MKNQRFVSFNNFFAVTGRWIKETYLFKPSVDYRSTIFNPVITQLNQIILPPFKLPYFEKIGDDKKLYAEVLTDLIFFNKIKTKTLLLIMMVEEFNIFQTKFHWETQWVMSFIKIHHIQHKIQNFQLLQRNRWAV